MTETYPIFQIFGPTISGWLIANPAHPVPDRDFLALKYVCKGQLISDCLFVSLAQEKRKII